MTETDTSQLRQEASRMIVPIRTPEDARQLIDDAIEWLVDNDGYEREDLENYLDSSVEMAYENQEDE